MEPERLLQNVSTAVLPRKRNAFCNKKQSAVMWSASSVMTIAQLKAHGG